MGGIVPLTVVPSGVVISISVDGEVSTPRFCAGIWNSSVSPGRALYPLAWDNIVVSSPLILVTIIESGFAIRSTPTTDKSITIEAAPTTLLTGSQIMTPLLDQSSEAADASL